MRRFLALATAIGAFSAASVAQTPTPLTLKQVTFDADINRAVLIVPDPTDSSNLYVVEQKRHDIRHVSYDAATDTYTLTPTVFLDLTGKVNSAGNEQGLLGMCFHPDYETNGYFYVNYTSQVGGQDTVVERYTALSPTQADPNSDVLILGPINQPQSNHNGGMIEFGPDGKLYVATGDGGNFNDTGSGHVSGGNSQSGANLLGKLLRINDDGTIPADNPAFTNPALAGFQPEIFHYGLRNPWRFSFDSETGDIWIGDVGQNVLEEIDFIPAGTPGGLNFGWRCKEGFNNTGLSGCNPSDPSLVDPVLDYNHAQGRCSVTGGYVYRGIEIPDLVGKYFYADYCGDQVYTVDGPDASTETAVGNQIEANAGVLLNSITSFGQDNEGRVFIVEQDGDIWRIENATAFRGRGFSKTGTNGDPVLWGIGDLTAGSAGELNLRNANNSALAALFVSLTENPTSFKGGTLIAVPPLFTINLTTSPSGELFLPFVWPAGVPSGTELYFQYAIQDGGATQSVALSNGLQAVAP